MNTDTDTGINDGTEPADPFAAQADMPEVKPEEEHGTYAVEAAGAPADASQQLAQAVAPDNRPMFMLIIQDGAVPGQVDFAGVQRPQEFSGLFASHVIGRWLQENIAEVAERAREAEFVRRAAAASAPVEAAADETAPAIITGDRERTIVGAETPAVLQLGVSA